ILIQSVCETVVPKLIAEDIDIPLLHSLLQDVFPGVAYRRAEMAALRKEIAAVCKDCHLVFEEEEQASSQWVDKLQLVLC
uniref:Dynein heavy chain hydrolytic ATP-binding dynein motor region domain-containing protein n=1 Tax=Amphimedon queenslandica TaxID=400682 RepID=A0A1X7SI17_AMPQE